MDKSGGDAGVTSVKREKVRGWYDTFVKYRCICIYCRFDGGRTKEDWLQLQGDHLIPRHIAGDHSEDDLNRVLACYYCNTVKRQFFPEGEVTRVQDEAHQQRLIEMARAHIESKKARNWEYGGGVQKSYEFMMRDITGEGK